MENVEMRKREENDRKHIKNIVKFEQHSEPILYYKKSVNNTPPNANINIVEK
jgi:hypothetical protein